MVAKGGGNIAKATAKARPKSKPRKASGTAGKGKYQGFNPVTQGQTQNKK